MLSFEEILLSELMKIEGMMIVLLCSPTGRVIKKAIAEEFSDSKLGVQASLIKQSAIEVAEEIGLQPPDMTLIHCPGYYVAYVYLEAKNLIVLACFLDHVPLDTIFTTINSILVE